MITSRPYFSAHSANSNMRSGVRWAERIFASHGTASSSRISFAGASVSQSDLLPMTIATSGRVSLTPASSTPGILSCRARGVLDLVGGGRHEAPDRGPAQADDDP